jgi:hypothetical protein
MIKNILTFFIIVTLAVPYSLFAESTDISNDEKMSILQSEIVTMHKLMNPETIAPLADDEIREIIELGTNWLKASNEPTGHFAYEYFPYEDRYAKDDNIVRQAGALFELGEIERRDTEGKYDLDKTIERAIGYFDSLTKSGRYNGEDILCIASDPEGSICKLGTTSLAFIGILNYVTANPDKLRKYEDFIDGYASYILSMQQDSGGFREIFSTRTGIAEEKESSYANGEAYLALVRYAKWKGFPDHLQKKIALTSSYLVSPDTIFDPALYLWAMAGMKDWVEFKPDARYSKYVKDYTDWRMDAFTDRRRSAHNFCAYIEGVVSAYSILEDSLPSNELTRYDEEIDFWLAKSALLQLREEHLIKYYILSNRFMKAPIPAWSLGGFLTGHTELSQRIDFTQHCLSSYVQKLVDIDKKSL